MSPLLKTLTCLAFQTKGIVSLHFRKSGPLYVCTLPAWGTRASSASSSRVVERNKVKMAVKFEGDGTSGNGWRGGRQDGSTNPSLV
jgi:hypothetical protein